MSSVDNRIVKATFDNKNFEKNAQNTLKTLDALDKGMKLDGAAKGLSSLEKAANGMSLDGVTFGVQSLADRFSTLGIVGMTVVQNLTNSLLDFGKNVLRKIWDPIVEGGAKRAMNIEQAKFQFEGLGMDVEAAMKQANYAVTDTAYGLDEAAKAAAQFAASGMEAGDAMGKALRAISGTAAMTNSSYEDIARIFTTVSGNGRLMGDQLNQLSSRGLNAAATLAKAMNTSEESVRKMVSKGQISFEMFYTAMDDAFGEHATKANETYSGSLANIRANLARIGAEVATPYYQNMIPVNNALILKLKEIKNALTPTYEALSNFMEAMSKVTVSAINSLHAGTVAATVGNLASIFINLGTGILSVINPIQEAWNQVFPVTTENLLVRATTAIANFFGKFKMGEKSAENLKRTFAGLFSILQIIWKAFQFLGEVVGKVLGLFSFGSTGLIGRLLETTATFGDFLVALNESIDSSEVFEKALQKVGEFLDMVKERVLFFAGKGWKAMTDFASGLNLRIPNKDEVLGFFSMLWDKIKLLGPMFQSAGNAVKNFFSKFSAPDVDFTKFGEKVGNTLKNIGNFFKSVGQGIKDAFKDVTFGDVANWIKTALIAAFGVLEIGVVKTILDVGKKTKSIIDSFSDVLGGLTGVLEGMQSKLKAEALINIAKAIALLAASLLILTFTTPDKLTASSAAMVALVGGLILVMNQMSKLVNNKDIGKMSAVSGALILLSVAVGILALSVKALAKLELAKLAQGLVAVIIMIAALVAAAIMLEKHASAMITSAASLTAMAKAVKKLATSIIIITLAIKILGSMSWGELLRGMTGFVVILGGLAGFFALMPKPEKITKMGASLMAMGVALVIFAAAFKILATMSWEGLLKGMLAFVGIFGGLLLFFKLLPNPASIAAMGASLLAISVALTIFALAFKIIATMSWEGIAKGLVTMAAALLILVGIMYIMPGALPGAAAMIVMAVALGLLAGVLILFGLIPMSVIEQGLTSLTKAFIVFGTAGLILGILSPLLLLAGAALMMFGTSLLFAGVGLVLITVAMAAFSAMGTIGIPMMLLFGVAAAALGLASPLILAFGVALTVLAVAITVAAVGFLALGLGLLVFAAAAPLAILTLDQFLVAISGMMNMIGDLALLGAALAAFGIGAAAAAVGTLALGVGFALLAGGVALLGLSLPLLGSGLASLMIGMIGIPVLDALMARAPDLLSSTLGLAAFGLAAHVAGPGFAKLGMGLMMLGASGLAWVPMLLILAQVTPILLDEAFGLGAFGVAANIAGPGLSKLGAGLKVLGASGYGWIPMLAAMDGLFRPLLDDSFGLGAFGLAADIAGKGIGKLGPALATLPIGMVGLPVLIAMDGIFKPLLDEAFGLAAFGVAALAAGKGLSSLGPAMATLPEGEAGIETLKMMDGVFAPLLDEAFGLGAFGIAAKIAGPALQTLADGLVTLSGENVPNGIDILAGLDDVFAPLLDDARGLKAFGKAAIKGAEGLTPLANGIVKLSQDGTSGGIDILRSLAGVFEPLLDDAKGLKKFGEASTIAGPGLEAISRGMVALSGDKIPNGIDVLKSLPDAFVLLLDDAKGLEKFGTAASTAGPAFELLAAGIVAFENTREGLALLNSFGFALERMQDKLDILTGFAKVAKDSHKDITNLANSLTTAGDAYTALGTGLTTVADGMTAMSGQTSESMATAAQSVADYAQSFPDISTTITNAIKPVQKAVEDLIKGINDKIKGKKDEVKSTTKTDLMDKGIIQGIKDKKTETVSAMQTVLDNLVSAICNMYNEFKNAGAYLGDGFIAGIKSKEAEAGKAGTALGKAALDAAKKALDSNSPSKEAYQLGGPDFAGTFVAAIHPYVALAAAEAEAMGDATVNGLSKAIEHIAEFVDQEMDFDPTIRPVLDLDELTSEMSALDELFGNRTLDMTNGLEKARNVGATVRENAEARAEQNKQVVKEGDKYEYTQNNYSPKAMDRLALYRQGKNLFAQHKNTVEVRKNNA